MDDTRILLHEARELLVAACAAEDPVTEIQCVLQAAQLLVKYLGKRALS